MKEYDIQHIREIAKKFTPEQIERCITQQLETGTNVCHIDETTEKTINELAKAEVVRELMNQGMDMADAFRELARRMRLVQAVVKKREGDGTDESIDHQRG